jgi:site-specific DNA recombinase
MVALYARVSPDQQAKNDNVGSQIDLLKAKIEADGEILIEDMMFVDAGISGATLIRPQLERLRDTASLGVIDLLYTSSHQTVYPEDTHTRPY